MLDGMLLGRWKLDVKKFICKPGKVVVEEQLSQNNNTNPPELIKLWK